MSDGIYPDDDPEPQPRYSPTSVRGGSAVLPVPPLPRGGGTGRWSPPPPQDTSPYYRTQVPRHAVLDGERGRADPALVPVDLVTDSSRGGGPKYAFPYDPRSSANYGALQSIVPVPEDVVFAALHDRSQGVPAYLGGWIYQRGAAGQLPPTWLYQRLCAMASRGNEEAGRQAQYCREIANFLTRHGN